MGTVRRLGVLCLVFVLTLLLGPVPARAGGWWSNIHLQSSYLVTGHTVHAETEFLFRSIDEAEQARRSGRFFVYLIHGFDHSVVDAATDRPEPPPGWWTIGDASAFLVGRVTLRGWDANLAMARASFVVPSSLEPGRYALMFCDAGCANPLGDIVPLTVTVMPNTFAARLAERIDRLDARVGGQRRALDRINAALEAQAASADVGSLRARISVLEHRLERVSERAPESETRPGAPGPPWWAFLGWFLAGSATAAALVAVGRMRRRFAGTTSQPTNRPEEPATTAVIDLGTLEDLVGPPAR